MARERELHLKYDLTSLATKIVLLKIKPSNETLTLDEAKELLGDRSGYIFQGETIYQFKRKRSQLSPVSLPYSEKNGEEIQEIRTNLDEGTQRYALAFEEAILRSEIFDNDSSDDSFDDSSDEEESDYESTDTEGAEFYRSTRSLRPVRNTSHAKPASCNFFDPKKASERAVGTSLGGAACLVIGIALFACPVVNIAAGIVFVCVGVALLAYAVSQLKPHGIAYEQSSYLLPAPYVFI